MRRALPLSVVLWVASAVAQEPSATPPAFTGVLVETAAVDISMPHAGRLVSVAVQVGAQVERGDVIATLDDTHLRQELTIATADLAARRAELRKADLELAGVRARRTRTASLGDLVSAKERAAAVRGVELATSDVEIARTRAAAQFARLEQLEDRVAQLTQRAPFSGTIAARFVDPGAQLAAGTPVVRLTVAGAFVVRFAVPPARRDTLSVGVRAEVAVRGAGAGATATPATVRRIWPEVDGASGMLFVEAEMTIKTDGGGWRCGQVVEVRIAPSIGQPDAVRVAPEEKQR